MKRCDWVTEDLIYIKYHDEEWGQFNQFTNDHYLFEMLTLEGAQAGLSWLTILKRRHHYQKAFDYFDPREVAKYDELKIKELLSNERIIRNRRKVESTIKNAQAFLAIQEKYGSFHAYLRFIIDQELPIVNEWSSHEAVPAQTDLSKQLSKALKKEGFSFVGPVICYAFMQAVGIVNDHTKDCDLYKGGK
ncbi:MAG TPA: DNA-3-methyladenine glycosylase I [Pseudogracilibacillus sp.]|nr:DNA-3-methyladenine glycosylase I [Pseudogracilibacillus sp.]